MKIATPKAHTRADGFEYIACLPDAERCYERMLQGIDGAQNRVSLATYIFANDDIGQRFVEALGRAQARGVTVRIIIDALGLWYPPPYIVSRLRRHCLDVRLASRTSTRYHRKLLLVDGTLAFFGGRNIRASNVETSRSAGVQDLHFATTSDTCQQLEAIFADDWARLGGRTSWHAPAIQELEPSAPRAHAFGGSQTRGACLMKMLLRAVNRSRASIVIATPYFVPPTPLRQGLLAALANGIKLEVIVPARGNIPPVNWAMEEELRIIARHGGSVFKSTGPFDHSKALVVDDDWSLVGSSNWDYRSFMNDELCVEVRGKSFAEKLTTLLDEKKERSVPYTCSRSPNQLVRMRNAMAYALRERL